MFLFVQTRTDTQANGVTSKFEEVDAGLDPEPPAAVAAAAAAGPLIFPASSFAAMRIALDCFTLATLSAFVFPVTDCRISASSISNHTPPSAFTRARGDHRSRKQTRYRNLSFTASCFGAYTLFFMLEFTPLWFAAADESRMGEWVVEVAGALPCVPGVLFFHH